MGMPRRYHVYPDEFQVLNVLSTAGSSILAVGYLLPLFYLLWSCATDLKLPPTRGVRAAWNGLSFSAACREF
jgi:heme/copper-type cytochrome/quinol oxidase subunit 1